MTLGKFVIHISGPGCSGKSSLAEALGAKFPGTYLVSYDKLKWQLFGYDRTKPENKILIKDIQLGFFQVICRKSIPILLDFFFESEVEYARAKNIAEDYGYKMIHVGLTAPKEVLLTRFRARIKSAKENGTRVSLTDENIFLAKLPHKSFVPVEVPIFDTSVIDVKEVAEKIAGQLSSAGLI